MCISRSTIALSVPGIEEQLQRATRPKRAGEVRNAANFRRYALASDFRLVFYLQFYTTLHLDTYVYFNIYFTRDFHLRYIKLLNYRRPENARISKEILRDAHIRARVSSIGNVDYGFNRDGISC